MAWLAPWSAILPSLVALAVFDASAWACLLCFTSYEERLQICQIFAGLDSPDLGKCEEAFTDAFKGLLDTEISEETTPPPQHPPQCGGARGYTEGGTREAWRDLRGTETQRWENGGVGSRDRRPRDDHLRAVVPGEAVLPSPCLPPPDYKERGQLHDAFTQMTHSLQEMAAAQGEWGGVHSAGRWMSEPLGGGGQGEESPECDSDLDGRMPRELGDLVRKQRWAGPGGFRAEGT